MHCTHSAGREEESFKSLPRATKLSALLPVLPLDDLETQLEEGHGPVVLAERPGVDHLVADRLEGDARARDQVHQELGLGLLVRLVEQPVLGHDAHEGGALDARVEATLRIDLTVVEGGSDTETEPLARPDETVEISTGTDPEGSVGRVPADAGRRVDAEASQLEHGTRQGVDAVAPAEELFLRLTLLEEQGELVVPRRSTGEAADLEREPDGPVLVGLRLRLQPFDVALECGEPPIVVVRGLHDLLAAVRERVPDHRRGRLADLGSARRPEVLVGDADHRQLGIEKANVLTGHVGHLLSHHGGNEVRALLHGDARPPLAVHEVHLLVDLAADQRVRHPEIGDRRGGQRGAGAQEIRREPVRVTHAALDVRLLAEQAGTERRRDIVRNVVRPQARQSRGVRVDVDDASAIPHEPGGQTVEPRVRGVRGVARLVELLQLDEPLVLLQLRHAGLQIPEGILEPGELLDQHLQLLGRGQLLQLASDVRELPVRGEANLVTRLAGVGVAGRRIPGREDLGGGVLRLPHLDGGRGDASVALAAVDRRLRGLGGLRDGGRTRGGRAARGVVGQRGAGGEHGGRDERDGRADDVAHGDLLGS